MKTITLISLLCVTILRPSNHKDVSVSPNFFGKHNLIDTSRYAIIKYNKDRDINHGFDKDSKAADLSSTDITKIEELIRKTVTTYNQSEKKGIYPLIIKHPGKYYKQIVAVLNSKNQKEVWVSCSCSVYNKSDWKKEIILTNDGGSCYFQIKINLDTNTVSDFRVNGVA